MIKISSKAYVKMYLHACKYPSSCIGGYIIGSNDNDISDVLPVCHNAPIGPILDIAAGIADNIETGKKVIGYYCTNTTLNDNRLGLYYVPKVIDSISSNNNNNAILININSNKMSNNDENFIEAKDQKGINMTIKTAEELKVINQKIDSLLANDSYMSFVDFEEHMEASLASKVLDFQNKFVEAR